MQFAFAAVEEVVPKQESWYCTHRSKHGVKVAGGEIPHVPLKPNCCSKVGLTQRKLEKAIRHAEEGRLILTVSPFKVHPMDVVAVL